jgi:hypothetical protein
VLIPCSHVHRCIWHLAENLNKNLHAIFGADYDQFIGNFYGAAYACTEEAMLVRWGQVMEVSCVLAQQNCTKKRNACAAQQKAALQFTCTLHSSTGICCSTWLYASACVAAQLRQQRL